MAETGGSDRSWLDFAFLGCPDFQSRGPKYSGFRKRGRRNGVASDFFRSLPFLSVFFRFFLFSSVFFRFIFRKKKKNGETPFARPLLCYPEILSLKDFGASARKTGGRPQNAKSRREGSKPPFSASRISCDRSGCDRLQSLIASVMLGQGCLRAFLKNNLFPLKSADCKRGRRKGATSKNVKNRQKVSKSFSTLFDNFRKNVKKRQKSPKSVKKFFDTFRHFSRGTFFPAPFAIR